MKKFLLSAALLFVFPALAHAVGMAHEFAVDIGPFAAAEASFSYNLQSNSYAVSSHAETANLFDALYPFRADYHAAGIIKKSGLVSTSYSYKSRSRFNTRTKQIVYSPDGTPLYRLSGKNGKQKKVDIADNPNYGGTTDLQTVFAELADIYLKTGSCRAKMQVFDGKRRFDVIFEDLGSDTLSSIENSPYFGAAHKCSMYIDKLNEDGDDMLWQLTSEKPIYFWLMTQNKLPFIARISIAETPLGELTAYTRRITPKD